MADDQKPKEFEPVTDAREMIQFLEDGAKHLSPATLWTENQDTTLQTHLSMFSPSEKTLYTWAPTNGELNKFLEDLAKKTNKDCFFSVSLPTANLFFKTQFKEQDTMGLQFEIPKRVFKVQRRKAIRYAIPEGHTLKVDFQDPLFPEKFQHKKAYDISSGGISFLVPEDDSPLYPQGLVLKEFSFTIKSKLIKTEVEIRHVQEAPDRAKVGISRPGVKIGVSFVHLSSEHTQIIAEYVLDESRKYFSRFL